MAHWSDYFEIPSDTENGIFLPEKTPTILIVDNNEESRAETKLIIENLGYKALTADSGRTCIELINSEPFDLLLLDIQMPGENGLEVLNYIRKNQITIPVIVISGSNDLEQAIFSLKLGAYQYLIKPVKGDRIESTVKNALREFELRRKIRLYSEAITQMPLGVVITNKDGIIEYVNPAFTALTGYTESEAKGQNTSILKSGKQSHDYYQNFWSTINAGHIWQGEFINRKKNGELYTEYSIVSPITGSNKLIAHFIAIKQDLTERKREQQALAESEQSFQELADLLPQPVFEVDLNRHISFGNKAGLELFGYSKDVLEHGFDCLRLFSPEEHSRVRESINLVFQGSSADNHEYNAVKSDGTNFPILLYTALIIRNDKPIGIRGIGLDITERIRTEETLRELNQTLEERVKERTHELEFTHQQMALQEKLASIGQLSAGLAHEINNPINFVRINFATLREDITDMRSLLQEYRSMFRALEDGRPTEVEFQKVKSMEKELDVDMLLNNLPELFAESERGFERVSTIIKSMRNFSFQHAIDERVRFDINKGIRDTLIITRNEYRYYAKVETILEEIPPVPCNPEQINQVFLNLIINSAHAIASQNRENRGHITIRTSFDKDSVYCTIADDGPGMPPETMRRIFEPFFTTKEPGQGTGLGLSISYDIIARKHGGMLTVSCPPEGGTVFTIRLPQKIKKEVTAP
ncbi:MAG: PAS domain S-box protein [Chlorobiaceae bacterium]|nr:PAS domain S-box protein [Chlorobiaceae bacterium]